MDEELEWVRIHKPDGATHWGRYPTGKVFFALAYVFEPTGETGFLLWFDHIAKWYQVHDTSKLEFYSI